MYRRVTSVPIGPVSHHCSSIRSLRPAVRAERCVPAQQDSHWSSKRSCDQEASPEAQDVSKSKSCASELFIFSIMEPEELNLPLMVLINSVYSCNASVLFSDGSLNNIQKLIYGKRSELLSVSDMHSMH